MLPDSRALHLQLIHGSHPVSWRSQTCSSSSPWQNSWMQETKSLQYESWYSSSSLRTETRQRSGYMPFVLITTNRDMSAFRLRAVCAHHYEHIDVTRRLRAVCGHHYEQRRVSVKDTYRLWSSLRTETRQRSRYVTFVLITVNTERRQRSGYVTLVLTVTRKWRHTSYPQHTVTETDWNVRIVEMIRYQNWQPWGKFVAAGNWIQLHTVRQSKFF
jgi:hypothetical protein